MNAVKRFFNWCYENGHVEEMPRFPKLPALDTEKFIPPTPEELDRLLAVSPPHIQRVILLGSQFGMRVGDSELFRLRWEDVDTVAKLMGHTTPTMVLTHDQHVMDKQKKATVESLPELHFILPTKEPLYDQTCMSKKKGFPAFAENP